VIGSAGTGTENHVGAGKAFDALAAGGGLEVVGGGGAGEDGGGFGGHCGRGRAEDDAKLAVGPALDQQSLSATCSHLAGACGVFYECNRWPLACLYN